MPQDRSLIGVDTNEKILTELPKLCNQGHVVVFTRSYCVAGSGSAATMRNLLSQFDPQSYSVIAGDLCKAKSMDVGLGMHVRPLNVALPKLFPKRFEYFWKRLHHPFLLRNAIRLIQPLSPAVIIGVFPDVEFLSLARQSAKALQIPWLAYLHDTIVEPMQSNQDMRPYLHWGRILQSQVFSEASAVLVTGDGMAEFYKRKYKMQTTPLQISYPEPIPTELDRNVTIERQVFMGGSVYSVNARSVKRVLTALESLQCPFMLATASPEEMLARYGITGEFVRKVYIRDRQTYIDTLRRQSVLVVALDWPDESDIHEDELSTAFPTKAVEYLASGRPILIHCPEHYFVARFFRQNRCGIVVSERDTDAIAHAIERLMRDDESDILELRKAALLAARIFAVDRLVPIFKSKVSGVSALNWGQKLSAAS